MIQLSVLQTFADLFSNFKNIEIGQIAMLAIGAVLIYLAIKKEMEPSLLLPLGFGTILVNLPRYRRRRPYHGAFQCRHQHGRAFPAAAVYRYRRNDRFRPAA